MKKHADIFSENYKIISIDDRTNKDTFFDTQQETIDYDSEKMTLMKKQKRKMKNFALIFQKILSLTLKKNITKLNSIIHGSTTLSKLGYNVNVGTGSMEPTQRYSTNNTTDTRLIYNSDIEDKKIGIKKYKNPDKKNFIQKSNDWSQDTHEPWIWKG